MVHKKYLIATYKERCKRLNQQIVSLEISGVNPNKIIKLKRKLKTISRLIRIENNILGKEGNNGEI